MALKTYDYLVFGLLGATAVFLLTKKGQRVATSVERTTRRTIEDLFERKIPEGAVTEPGELITKFTATRGDPAVRPNANQSARFQTFKDKVESVVYYNEVRPYTIQEGETLLTIADREYSDQSLWTAIADASYAYAIGQTQSGDDTVESLILAPRADMASIPSGNQIRIPPKSIVLDPVLKDIYRARARYYRYGSDKQVLEFAEVTVPYHKRMA
jgi:hypothetical protein